MWWRMCTIVIIRIISLVSSHLGDPTSPITYKWNAPKFVWNTGGISVGARIQGQGARTNFSGAPFTKIWGARERETTVWVLGGARPQWSAGAEPLVRESGGGRTLSVLGSRVWPFGVMWRHRSRDHFFTPYAISYCGPLELSLYF